MQKHRCPSFQNQTTCTHFSVVDVVNEQVEDPALQHVSIVQTPLCTVLQKAQEGSVTSRIKNVKKERKKKEKEREREIKYSGWCANCTARWRLSVPELLSRLGYRLFVHPSDRPLLLAAVEIPLKRRGFSHTRLVHGNPYRMLLESTRSRKESRAGNHNRS